MISANNLTVWSIGLLLVTSFVAGTAAADDSAHIGFADEYAEYSDSSELGEDYSPTGDDDPIGEDWQVSQATDEEDQHLQAINQGTGLVLDNDVHLAGDRVVDVDLKPLRNTVSSFYSAAVNLAEDVVMKIGDVTGNGNVDTLNLHMGDQGPGETLSFNDRTKDIDNHIEHNEWVNMEVAVSGDTLEVTLTPDEGSAETITFEDVDVATGTIELNQPQHNTARVLVDDLVVADTPSEAQNVQAFAGPGMTEVTVNWDAPALDGGDPSGQADDGIALTGYNVFHGTSADDLELVAQVGPSTTEYTHQTGYTDTSGHYFAVTAMNDVGESPLSDEACDEVAPLGIVMQPNPVLGCSR